MRPTSGHVTRPSTAAPGLTPDPSQVRRALRDGARSDTPLAEWLTRYHRVIEG